MHQNPQTLGWVCSYTPLELIVAAGLRPYKLLTDASQGDSSGAESHLPSAFCPYVRRLCSLCLQDSENVPPLILLVLSCDPMRRLADIIDSYSPSREVIRLDIPRRRDSLALGFLEAQLQALLSELEIRSGKNIFQSDLSQAIQDMNHIRSQLAEISDLRSQAPHLLPASGFLDLVRFSQTHLPAETKDLLAGRIQDLRAGADAQPPQGRPRLLLTGSIIEDPDLVQRISELGGDVVCEDICSGERDILPLTDTTLPPVQAIARRMLSRPPCARMLGSKERIDRTVDLAGHHACHGVIIHTLKFCDLTQADLPRLQSELKKHNIPCVHLEQDALHEDRGQLTTRIQAFLETLA
jgi:benzoyl-CoA reductase/2-hydroxyglutaryl-CoA dehydratase subunit BcrC/BadD/HgdB